MSFNEYQFVDFYNSDEAGKSKPWIRIHKDEIKSYAAQANNFNCFATVQMFKSKEQGKGEAYIAPLFFDLDFKDDPEVSRQDAIKIIAFFTQELDLFDSDIEVFFSGSKGFHILINPVSLGIQPRDDLHKVFKHISGYLKYRLTDVAEGLQSLDFVVYTSKRMLRLENSVHHKTRLFKIRLTLEELKLLSLEQIKDLAIKPRQLEVDTEKIGIREQGFKFYSDKLHEYMEAKNTTETKYNDEFNFKNVETPVCVLDILHNGWKKEGDRNQATVQLSCYFKEAGYTREDTLEKLTEWVTRFTSASGNYSLAQRVANTKSVIDTVFSNDSDYKFGCAFIRSLHGAKSTSGDYERVNCAGDLCPCLKVNSDEEVENAPKLHLSNTGDAEYEGKLVKTDVMVVGKRDTPYLIPRRVEYSCWGAEKCKNGFCPLKSVPNNTAYLDLGVQNPELIEMCGIGKDNVTGILRKLACTPNCKKFEVEILERTNVEELLVTPKVETNIVDDIEGRYVKTKIYVIENTSLEVNRYYELTGYVYAHPKTQEATVMVKQVEPLEDAVGSFQLTSEVKEELKIFQPSQWTLESIHEKIETLINDLTYNVTQIVERDEVHLGILLVLHSILNFEVPWDNNPIRGWLELNIVGDTGTGKSMLIEKLLEFIGLGTRVNAESTSRTGLAYKMEQAGGSGSWYITWGAWPLADKRVIWIDEASGIPKEEYGMMTMARSSGKLEVKRAVTAETTCRVRAILSGNVVNGKRLSDYTQGVESLKEIFNNEDIRRFDFGIFMKTTDVSSEKYNRQLPTYPRTVNDEQLRNNVLFAWSRNYDQVEFEAPAVDKVLEVSTKLAKIYGKANDVPLVSPSDQRNKIARLATALAVLTHSVDETGEKIIVRECHAEYIFHYLREIYNAPGARLNYYAKLSITESEVTNEEYGKITGILKQIQTLKDVKGKTSTKFLSFIMLFQQQKYLYFTDLEAMLGIEKEEAKEVVMCLVKLRMLTKHSGGYKKTSRFNSYISKIFEAGEFDGVDLDYL